MQGKVRRLNLGPKEKLRILEAAYSDWLLGYVQDKSKLINAIGDNRAHALAETWLDDPMGFASDWVEFVNDKETKARIARLQRHGRPAGLAAMVAEGDTARGSQLLKVVG